MLTLMAVPRLDLIGSICSLSVPHFSHAFLELAAHGNYSASKILCLNLLLSSLNLFSFPVPHQRFLLSNWVYDLCRSVVCRFPPLFTYLSAFSSFLFCLYLAYVSWPFTSVSFDDSHKVFAAAFLLILATFTWETIYMNQRPNFFCFLAMFMNTVEPVYQYIAM